MVKFRFMLIAILLVSASANMSAAWRIVFDRNCLKIVMANTASQKVIEEQHNQRVGIPLQQRSRRWNSIR